MQWRTCWQFVLPGAFGEETFHLDNDVVLGEDFYMNLCLGIKAKRIGLNNSLVYVYIENEYSATHNYEFVSVLPLKHQLESVRRILKRTICSKNFHMLIMQMQYLHCHQRVSIIVIYCSLTL